MSEPLQQVQAFFDAWAAGRYAQLRSAYQQFLSEDCVYENCGVPACRGMTEILAFIDLAQKARDIQAIRVELIHAAVNGNVVFTERWDRHVNGAGVEVYPVRIVGVMELRDGKIVAWRDYFDPTEQMQQLAEAERT